MAATKDERVAKILWTFVPVLCFFIFSRAAELPLDALHFIFLQLLLVMYLQPDLGFQYQQQSSSSPFLPTAKKIEHESEPATEAAAAGEASTELTIDKLPAMPSGNLPSNPQFKDTVQEMIRTYLQLTENDSDAEWEIKVNTPQLRIFQKRGTVATFKLLTTMDNTPLTCFDLMTDAVKRKQWDTMTDEARVIQEIDKDTRIVYVRTKGFMFTSPREILVLSHKTKLPDGRLLNVTRSISHPECPENPKSGYVRMTSEIAGIICSASKTKPGCCDVFQIIDGDPKGNIPQAVINFVLTSALPGTTAKMNQRLASVPALESALVRRPAQKGRVDPAVSDYLKQLQKKVDDLEKQIQLSVTKPSAIEQVREALGWSSPFILGVIYIVGVYYFFRSARANA